MGGDYNMHYEMLEIFNTFIIPFLVLYFMLFLFLFGKRYLRMYDTEKRLKFTQEEVKDRRKEILILKDKILELDLSPGKVDVGNVRRAKYQDYIIRTFTIYNELIVGIYTGIYDENYIKMAIGTEILDFYKMYADILVNNASYRNERFMALEMLLKEWEKEGFSVVRKNRRRMY
mgnify:CR=1 FL=1